MAVDAASNGGVDRPAVHALAVRSESVQPVAVPSDAVQSRGVQTSERDERVHPVSVQSEDTGDASVAAPSGVQSWTPAPVRSVAARQVQSPARDRADRAAQRYATQHGELPTVTRLMQLAEVSRGTAGEALKVLRNQPTPLHLVSGQDRQEAQS